MYINNMVNFIESIPFRTIKILNIGYLGIIYSVLTITISILIILGIDQFSEFITLNILNQEGFEPFLNDIFSFIFL